MKIVLKINHLLDKHNEMFGDIELFHISEDHGECEICEELQQLGFYLEHGIKDTKDIAEFEANKEFYIKRKEEKEKKIYPNRKAGTLRKTSVTKEEYLALPSGMQEYKKAEKLNVSLKTLVNKRKKWGLLARHNPRKRIKKPLVKEEYLALPNSMSEREKAEKLDVCYKTLQRRCKDWGIHPNNRKRAIAKSITKEEFEALPKELSVAKKAQLLGCTRQTVYNFINKEYKGEELKQMRGESRNDSYFRRL